MNFLRIEAAGLIEIGGRLPVPVGNARIGWRERHGVALRLEADGMVGWGECSPLPGVSLDRLPECVAALERLFAGELPRIDLDAPFGDIAALVNRLPVGVPSARFALDTALLDMCAQIYDCAVAELIGEASAPIATSMIVGLDDWRTTLPIGLGRGIRTFKIKIGRPDARDMELVALAELRHAHPDLLLRLDANGGFGLDADDEIAELAALDPEWLEQPVPPGRMSTLAPPACPIAADESAGDEDDDLWQAVHRGIVSVLVIKPAVVGGVLASAALAERARSLGLEIVISHLHDGPIALAAAAELAVGLGGTRAAGLGPHAGLDAFPRVPVPQLAHGYVISTGPGLGVSLT